MTKNEETSAKELRYNTFLEKGIDIENRIIRINGDIDDEVFGIVDCGMTFFEKEKKIVTIRINSEGGSVSAAFAIVGRLKRHKIPIHTEGYGNVMSAATLLLACGDKRRLSELAMFMHHEASYAIEENTRLSEIKTMMKQWDFEEDIWAEKMAQYSIKPKTWWARQGVGKDAYFTAKQLLELGVIDDIF